MKSIKDLSEVILERKNSAEEGSYTGYLFNEGIDKILKKCGEEMTELVVATKSLEAAKKGYVPADEYLKLENDVVDEFSDLVYHLLVLLADREISLDRIDTVLSERASKTGNLKQFKTVDKNS